jgi:hypothetical protein
VHASLEKILVRRGREPVELPIVAGRFANRTPRGIARIEPNAQ